MARFGGQYSTWIKFGRKCMIFWCERSMQKSPSPYILWPLFDLCIASSWLIWWSQLQCICTSDVCIARDCPIELQFWSCFLPIGCCHTFKVVYFVTMLTGNNIGHLHCRLLTLTFTIFVLFFSNLFEPGTTDSVSQHWSYIICFPFWCKEFCRLLATVKKLISYCYYCLLFFRLYEYLLGRLFPFRSGSHKFLNKLTLLT